MYTQYTPTFEHTYIHKQPIQICTYKHKEKHEEKHIYTPYTHTSEYTYVHTKPIQMCTYVHKKKHEKKLTNMRT